MFYFSYRNRIRLRNAGYILGIAVLILAGLLIGGFLYLERYVVYTSDGARLEFPTAEETTVVVENPTFTVTETDAEVYELPEVLLPVVMEELDDAGEVVLSNQLKGYYIPPERLALPLDEALNADGSTLAVMVDLVNGYGSYHFSSTMAYGNYATSVNTATSDALLTELMARDDVYLIAALPAFQNSTQALANQNDGLVISGGALWMDSDGYYWMDPAKQSTLSYLETMAYVALDMGFDEIVYLDFYLPQSTSIIYGDASETAIVDAAAYLSTTAVADQINISFGSSDGGLLAYGDRLYLESGNASLIAELTEQVPEGKKAAETLVFLTTSRDTRFQDYGLIQPLS